MQLHRMISFAATLFLAGALSAAVVSEKEIPVRNPDFSQTKNNAPVGWWINPKLSVSAGKDGKTSFITLTSENDSRWLKIAQPVLSVKDFPPLGKDESYEFLLSYRQKSDGIQKCAFGCIGVYGKKERLAHCAGKNIKGTSAEWQDITVTWKLAEIPAETKTVNISFFLDGMGNVSFTDVKFVVRVVNNQ